MSEVFSTSTELRGFRVVIATAFGVFLLSTCITSRLYWGYWLTPPASDATARHLSEVTSFTSFWQSGILSGRPALSRAASQVNYVSGEAPGGRLPAALVKRGLLPASERPVDASVLRSFTAALAEAGLLRHGDPGYEHAAELQGHVAVGKGQDGRVLYVAALVGGEVSNDHRPYYEVVAEPTGTDRVTIRRYSFYWWDLAGAEGLAHWFGGIATTFAWILGAGCFLAIRRRIPGGRKWLERSEDLLQHK